MGQPAANLMTIGSVLSILQAEFPDSDVTVSKIRFLESEGLVTPVRTPSGYRKFSDDDVERLRYILRMQQEHFLPLRVIREDLERMDQGLEPVQRGGEATVTRLVLASDGDSGELQLEEAEARYSVKELASHAGLNPGDITMLRQMSLIEPDGDGTFSRADLEIVCTVAGLREFGIEAKHLALVRNAAQNQANLIVDRLKPQYAGGVIDEEELQDRVRSISGSLRLLQSLLLRAQVVSDLGLAGKSH